MKQCLSKIKAVLLSVLLLTTVYPGVPAWAAEQEDNAQMQLYAQSAVLMDAGSGRILYEKNGSEIRPMASTTKIMTCILALEYGNLEDMVTVSAYAASMPKVKLDMRSGETYRLKDLLYSLMLESHNDSAVAIAEHIGGSVEGFAAMMNQKAADIGCFDTFFITPNGLDAEAATEDGETKIHSTTAADLARIMSYCIMDSPEKDTFLEITRTQSWHFQEEGGSGRSFDCSNHNAFLTMMEGALSGKTGFTGNAGYCYVGSLERDGRTYVVALLACGWPSHKSYKWSDTKKLMDYGLKNYSARSLSEVQIQEEDLQPLRVLNAQTENLGEKAYVPVEIVRSEQAPVSVLMKESENFEIRTELTDTLTAPVETGTEVGTVSYLLDGEIYGVDYIVTAGAAEKIDYLYCLKQIIRQYGVF